MREGYPCCLPIFRGWGAKFCFKQLFGQVISQAKHTLVLEKLTKAKSIFENSSHRTKNSRVSYLIIV